MFLKKYKFLYLVAVVIDQKQDIEHEITMSFKPDRKITMAQITHIRKQIEDKFDEINNPIDQLLDTQNIIDKYKEFMIDSDYMGACGNLKHISSH